MEKYIRLLNPKTTNYESTGGGSHGALTKEDVLLAMSYARLTPAQDTLIKCMIGNCTAEGIKQVSYKLISMYTLRDEHTSSSDHNGEIAFKVAMLELFACPANYQPSYRNRASLIGMSHMHVKRVLDHLIDDFKGQLEKDLKHAMDKISKQIKNHLKVDLIT